MFFFGKHIMDKLQWKVYLNSIVNTHDNVAVPYPSLENQRTYCFQFRRSVNIKSEIFSFCPRLGLSGGHNDFFKEYRVVALEVFVQKGEFMVNDEDKWDEKVSEFKKGDFKVTYWPNNPLLVEQVFDGSIDEYWMFKSGYLEICVNYEIIPLYPLITIPFVNNYMDVSGFLLEYNMIKKDIVNNEYVVKNDIIGDVHIKDLFDLINNLYGGVK